MDNSDKSSNHEDKYTAEDENMESEEASSSSGKSSNHEDKYTAEDENKESEEASCSSGKSSNHEDKYTAEDENKQCEEASCSKGHICSISPPVFSESSRNQIFGFENDHSECFLPRSATSGTFLRSYCPWTPNFVSYRESRVITDFASDDKDSDDLPPGILLEPPGLSVHRETNSDGFRHAKEDSDQEMKNLEKFERILAELSLGDRSIDDSGSSRRVSTRRDEIDSASFGYSNDRSYGKISKFPNSCEIRVSSAIGKRRRSSPDATREIYEPINLALQPTHQEGNASSIPLNNENSHMNLPSSMEQPDTAGFYHPNVKRLRAAASSSRNSTASTILTLPGVSCPVEREGRTSNELTLPGASNADVCSTVLSLDRDVRPSGLFEFAEETLGFDPNISTSDYEELDTSLTGRKGLTKKIKTSIKLSDNLSKMDTPKACRELFPITQNSADSSSTSEVLKSYSSGGTSSMDFEAESFNPPSERRSHKRSMSTGASPTSKQLDASNNKKLKLNKSTEDIPR